MSVSLTDPRLVRTLVEDGRAPESVGATLGLIGDGVELPMPSSAGMQRLIAADPVGATFVFRRIVCAVLRDVLGARAPATGDALPDDGCAASGDGGALGDVDAFFGVTECQARGSLHYHCLVWVLREWNASDDIDAIRERFFGPDGFRARFLRYVEAVSSESVHTLPAKLGAAEAFDDLPPLPLSAEHRRLMGRTAGDETAAEQRAEERAARDATADGAPLTGGAASRIAPAGQLPSYYVDAAVEASKWARDALDDAWSCAAAFGTHECRPGCGKKRPRVGLVCRHGYWHLIPRGDDRWEVARGKAADPLPDTFVAMPSYGELAAHVDPGIDAGGQDTGRIDRTRFHAWETRGTLAIALATRCNEDVSVVDHLPPEDVESRAALREALEATRDATAARVHYTMCYRGAGK